MATIDIALDVTKPVHDIAPIFGRQGDTATVIRATILNDGEPYDFSGKYLEFAMVRPGEKSTNWIHIRDGVVQEGDTNVWNVTLPAEATANDGLTKLAYFVVRDESDDGYRDSTERFTIAFDESATHTVKVTYYSDTVDRLIKECELLVEAWEAQMQEQQTAFQQAQDQRDQTFQASETSRAEAFQASESQRTQTFNASEASRASAFQQSESSRQSTFDANEQQRETDSDAAVQRANDAAQKVEEALSGDLSSMFDGYLDGKKDVAGGFPAYETYVEGIKNAGTPDDVTLAKDSSNKLLVKDGGISTAKLADQSVTTEKVEDLAITAGKLASNAVSSGKLASNAVTTAKINSKAVTLAKLGDDVTAAINSKPIGLDINAYTWEELSTIIYDDSITTEILQYLVGQTRYVTFSGYGTFAFQVIGVRHDDLSDGSGKAGLTFQSVPCITTHNMNSSNTTTGGWASTSMRSWLNSTMYNAISSDLKPYIKKVKKKYCATTTYSNVSTCDDYLFLASHMEVFGQTSYGAEGTWYQYWSLHNNNDDRIKYLNNSAQWWWLRSVSSASDSGRVSGGGSANTNFASRSYGVPPCFCI